MRRFMKSAAIFFVLCICNLNLAWAFGIPQQPTLGESKQKITNQDMSEGLKGGAEIALMDFISEQEKILILLDLSFTTDSEFVLQKLIKKSSTYSNLIRDFSFQNEKIKDAEILKKNCESLIAKLKNLEKFKQSAELGEASPDFLFAKPINAKDFLFYVSDARNFVKMFVRYLEKNGVLISMN